MTLEQIIKQTDSLTVEKQKTLIMYLMSKIIDTDFTFPLDSSKKQKPLNNFLKSKGILENVDISDISEEELYLQED
jgi:hypothetical protein